MTKMKDALQAKKRMLEIIKGVSGIKGVGITWDDNGEPCVQVNIDPALKKSVRNRIPSHIEDVKVKIEIVENIRLE